MPKRVVTWFETTKKCKDYDQTVLETHLLKREFIFNLKNLFVDDELYFEFGYGSDHSAGLRIEVSREVKNGDDVFGVESEHDRRIGELSTMFNPWLESKGWGPFVVCERPENRE